MDEEQQLESELQRILDMVGNSDLSGMTEFSNPSNSQDIMHGTFYFLLNLTLSIISNELAYWFYVCVCIFTFNLFIRDLLTLWGDGIDGLHLCVQKEAFWTLEDLSVLKRNSLG